MTTAAHYAKPTGLFLLFASAVAILVLAELAGWSIDLSMLLGALGIAVAVPVFVHMSSRAWRPALWLLVSTPVEAISAAALGSISHLFTPAAAAALLVATRGRLSTLVLLAPTQVIASLFVLSLLPSYVPDIAGLNAGAALDYGQKIGLLAILVILATGFRDPEHRYSILRLFVIAAAINAALSMAQFYLGIDALRSLYSPGSQGRVLGADEFVFGDGSFSSDARLWGLGHMGPNRFGMWLTLPLFLSLGWFLTARSARGKAVAGICAAALMMALAGTVTRASFLAAGIGLVLMVFAIRRRDVPAWLGIAAVAGLAALFVAQSVIGEVVWDRISAANFTADPERAALWSAAWSTAKSNGFVIGLGARNFGEQVAGPAGLGRLPAHNIFLTLLVEQGLIPLALLCALMLRVMYVLGIKRYAVDPEMRTWRLVFLAGLVAMLVNAFFAEYLYERVMWIPVAFAIAIEANDARHRWSSRSRPHVGPPA